MERLFRKGALMKNNPIDFTAEFSDAMVSTYETSAEPLSARLAKVALGRTTVSAGDRVLPLRSSRILSF
jgi:hypothetical protein